MFENEHLHLTVEDENNPELFFATPEFENAYSLINSLWPAFERSANDQNFRTREELRLRLERQVSKVPFGETFNEEQFAELTKAWSALVEALPKDKQKRLGLAQQCADQIKPFSMSRQLSEHNTRTYSQPDLLKYQFLLALLMHDQTVPTELLVDLKQLGLNEHLHKVLGNSIALVLKLNKDCLSPRFVKDLLKSEKEVSEERWEESVLLSLQKLLSKRQPSDKNAENRDAQESANLNQVLEGVKTGRYLLTEVSYYQDPEDRRNEIEEIYIKYKEKDSGQDQVLRLSSSLYTVSWTAARDTVTSVGFRGIEAETLRGNNVLFIDQDPLYKQPRVRGGFRKYSFAQYQSGWRFISITEPLIPNLKTLTHAQIEDLAQSGVLNLQKTEHKAQLPSRVANLLSKEVLVTGVVSEYEPNLELLVANEDNKESLFSLVRGQHSVKLHAAAELSPKYLGNSCDGFVWNEELDGQAELFDGLVSLDSHWDLDASIGRGDGTDYVIFELAGKRLVLAQDQNEIPRRDNSTEVSVSISTIDSYPSNRIDLQLLHEFVNTPADEESIVRIANQTILDIEQTALDEAVKLKLTQTISSFVRRVYSGKLLDRSVMSLIDKSSQITNEDQQETDESKKKKHQASDDTERRIQMSDWENFLRSITGQYLEYKSIKNEGVESLDFGNVTEAVLVRLFHQYRNDKDGLRQVLQTKLLEKATISDTKNGEKYLTELPIKAKIRNKIYGSFLGRKIGWQISDAVQTQVFRPIRSYFKNDQLDRNIILYPHQHINRILEMADRYWDTLDYAENARQTDLQDRSSRLVDVSEKSKLTMVERLAGFINRGSKRP